LQICVVVKTNRAPEIVDVLFQKIYQTVATNMVNILEGTGNDWLTFVLRKTDRVDEAQYCG